MVATGDAASRRRRGGTGRRWWGRGWSRSATRWWRCFRGVSLAGGGACVAVPGGGERPAVGEWGGRGKLWSVREDGGEEVLVADLRERLEGGPGKLEHLRLMAPLLERGFPERRGLYVFMNVRFRGGEAENR